MAPQEQIRGVQYLPDGSIVIASGSTIYYLELLPQSSTINQISYTIKDTIETNQTLVNCFQYLIDGRIVIGGNDGTIRIYQYEDEDEKFQLVQILRPESERKKPVTAIYVPPASDIRNTAPKIYSGHSDGKIIVWVLDTTTNEYKQEKIIETSKGEIQFKDIVGLVEIERRIIFANDNGTIGYFDLDETGRPKDFIKIIHQEKGNNENEEGGLNPRISDMIVSKDGKYIIVSFVKGENSIIKIFENQQGEEYKEIATLNFDNYIINKLQVDPNGQIYVFTSRGEIIYIGGQ
ncbi:MAG: hypothetical protein KatS3mg095_0332 [Candidatus Parcubacteria bacterium]|nr:MAG: hypothetical protein KatS3mg095_0332 [Candidatus Parcubacteria bacterium]